MSYYYPTQVHLVTAAAASQSVSICFHERIEIVAVKIVDHDGILADATNTKKFEVLGTDKATALFEWDTLNTKQGALAANTSADMLDNKRSDLAIFDAGQTVIIKVTHSNSGKATNAGICLQLRQARAY